MAPFSGVKITRAPGVDPKVKGHIKGVPVGKTFTNRAECSEAGIHAPLQSGIHGNGTDGAFSVVLSGGYVDDVDYGKRFIYTGQGGRDTRGSKLDQMRGKTLWEGPQGKDQEWVRGNKALKMSALSHEPVRVVRGPNPDSIYAPLKGYRYDGLYKVTSAWREKGKEGYKMCRFEFKRMKGQPPLPGAKPKRRKTQEEGSASGSEHASTSRSPFAGTYRAEGSAGPYIKEEQDDDDSKSDLHTPHRDTSLTREIFGESEDEEDDDDPGLLGLSGNSRSAQKPGQLTGKDMQKTDSDEENFAPSRKRLRMDMH